MEWLNDATWLERAAIGGIIGVVITCLIQIMLAVRSIDKNLANAINRAAREKRGEPD